LPGVTSGGVPYPLFALAGLVPWMYFANAVTMASNSLITSANLITKVYFPRVIIPAGAVLAGLVDFGIGFLLLLGLMLYYGAPITGGILMVPVMLVLLTLLAFGVGTWMAGLNVKYRDIRYALPFVVQLWLFASPVVYPASLVPERWHWLVRLNPIAGIVGGFRAALLGQALDWREITLAALVTAGVVVFACHAFATMEDRFADVI